MPTDYTESPKDKVLEFTVDDKVNRAESANIAARMEAFITRHGTVRMVEVVREFGGFDASLIWDGLKFDARNIRHISHCAVVSDGGWLGPVTRVASAVIPTRIKSFPMAALDEARCWIRDAEA